MRLEHRGTPIKISGVSHPLEGFYKGLGVVKGEGVASAKKRPPSHLKKDFFTETSAKAVAFAGFADLRSKK